jgi:hypothetical protein
VTVQERKQSNLGTGLSVKTKQLEASNLTENKLPIIVQKTNSAFDVIQQPNQSKMLPFSLPNEVESNLESPVFLNELKPHKSNDSDSQQSSDNEDLQSKCALTVNNDLFSPLPILPKGKIY